MAAVRHHFLGTLGLLNAKRPPSIDHYIKKKKKEDYSSSSEEDTFDERLSTWVDEERQKLQTKKELKRKALLAAKSSVQSSTRDVDKENTARKHSVTRRSSGAFSAKEIGGRRLSKNLSQSTDVDKIDTADRSTSFRRITRRLSRSLLQSAEPRVDTETFSRVPDLGGEEFVHSTPSVSDRDALELTLVAGEGNSRGGTASEDDSVVTLGAEVVATDEAMEDDDDDDFIVTGSSGVRLPPPTTDFQPLTTTNFVPSPITDSQRPPTTRFTPSPADSPRRPRTSPPQPIASTNTATTNSPPQFTATTTTKSQLLSTASIGTASTNYTLQPIPFSTTGKDSVLLDPRPSYVAARSLADATGDFTEASMAIGKVKQQLVYASTSDEGDASAGNVTRLTVDPLSPVDTDEDNNGSGSRGSLHKDFTPANKTSTTATTTKSRKKKRFKLTMPWPKTGGKKSTASKSERKDCQTNVSATGVSTTGVEDAGSQSTASIKSSKSGKKSRHETETFSKSSASLPADVETDAVENDRDEVTDEVDRDEITDRVSFRSGKKSVKASFATDVSVNSPLDDEQLSRRSNRTKSLQNFAEDEISEEDDADYSPLRVSNSVRRKHPKIKLSPHPPRKSAVKSPLSQLSARQRSLMQPYSPESSLPIDVLQRSSVNLEGKSSKRGKGKSSEKSTFKTPSVPNHETQSSSQVKSGRSIKSEVLSRRRKPKRVTMPSSRQKKRNRSAVVESPPSSFGSMDQSKVQRNLESMKESAFKVIASMHDESSESDGYEGAKQPPRPSFGSMRLQDSHSGAMDPDETEGMFILTPSNMEEMEEDETWAHSRIRGSGGRGNSSSYLAIDTSRGDDLSMDSRAIQSDSEATGEEDGEDLATDIGSSMRLNKYTPISKGIPLEQRQLVRSVMGHRYVLSPLKKQAMKTPGVRRSNRNRVQKGARYAYAVDGNALPTVIGTLEPLDALPERKPYAPKKKPRRKPGLQSSFLEEAFNELPASETEATLTLETSSGEVVDVEFMQHLSVCPRKSMDGGDATKDEDVIIFPVFTTDSCSIGAMVINVGGSKPSQVTEGAFIVFMLQSSSIELKINNGGVECTKEVKKISRFWIPEGVMYSMRNTGPTPAELMYVRLKS